MKTYDWIAIGAGFTGAALAYELAKTGFSVLLLEQCATSRNATRYSYGGLAFWSGTTPLTRQLCNEGMARYQVLSQELDADIEFRELDLLLTIATDIDPEVVAASYAHFAIPPKLLSVDEAWEMEPLLNRKAIAGALTVKHGHINPEKTAQAYIQAFLRAGGKIEITQVQNLTPSPQADRGVGIAIKTTTGNYYAANVVVCAGGLSRQLLKASGIPVRLYFTHAEMIETPPVEVQLRTLVMPANLKRFQLEAESSVVDELWNEPGNEPIAPILDAGAIQFQDGSLRLGQISRVLTDPNAKVDSQASESWLRQSIGEVLPALAKLPGRWHHCLVAFSSDRLPLIGSIPEFQGIYVFSGFSNPLVIVPPLAQRFAHWVSGQEDEVITQLYPAR
ncbi:MAG: FAD-binding oxidoreductase [Fischerella sp.]|uniref:NAD(P)/FAD-dependent oxidoreductase n=1 Tax=Fischerella sp. TaxID=1191 RepID=UPI00181D2C13|nr:FAD-binding oxidoreductase [Fischerella sp.]NWF61649.1 FAD-binding oxidoreductase [Fischerella sp.]